MATLRRCRTVRGRGRRCSWRERAGLAPGGLDRKVTPTISVHVPAPQVERNVPGGRTPSRRGALLANGVGDRKRMTVASLRGSVRSHAARSLGVVRWAAGTPPTPCLSGVGVEARLFVSPRAARRADSVGPGRACCGGEQKVGAWPPRRLEREDRYVHISQGGAAGPPELLAPTRFISWGRFGRLGLPGGLKALEARRTQRTATSAGVGARQRRKALRRRLEERRAARRTGRRARR